MPTFLETLDIGKRRDFLGGGRLNAREFKQMDDPIGRLASHLKEDKLTRARTMLGTGIP
jgi:hypothetical protein